MRKSRRKQGIGRLANIRPLFAYNGAGMPSAFVELHARSAFSFLHGGSVPEDYAGICADLDQPGMALLDLDGVYGSPRFHQAMTKAGLAPYVGAEVTCSDGARYP